MVGQARCNGKQIQIAQRAHGRVESRRPLGMIGARYVLFANRIRGKPCHYLPNSSSELNRGAQFRAQAELRPGGFVASVSAPPERNIPEEGSAFQGV